MNTSQIDADGVTSGNKKTASNGAEYLLARKRIDADLSECIASGRVSIELWVDDLKAFRNAAGAYVEELQMFIIGGATLDNFNFLDHLYRQRAWSEKTFGPGERTDGVLDHIRKELKEIERNPADVTEWIDVVILALDGAWRVGAGPEDIIRALVAKQTKNESRQWPDWRTAEPGKAIEHVRDDAAEGGAA